MYPRICPGRYLAVDVVQVIVPLGCTCWGREDVHKIMEQHGVLSAYVLRELVTLATAERYLIQVLLAKC